MFCTSCGNSFKEGARFCVRCGAAIAAPVTSGPPVAGVNPRRVTRRAATLALACISIIAAGAAAGFYWFFIRPASAALGAWESTPIQLHIVRVGLLGDLSGTIDYYGQTAPLSGRALRNEITIDAVVPRGESDPAALIHASGTVRDNQLKATYTDSAQGGSPAGAPPVLEVMLTRAASLVTIAAATPTFAPPRAHAKPAAGARLPSHHHPIHIAYRPVARPTPQTIVKIVTIKQTAVANTAATHTAAPTPRPQPPTPRQTAPPAAIVAQRPVVQRWSCALAGLGLTSNQQSRIQVLLGDFERDHPVGTYVHRPELRSLRSQILGVLSTEQAQEFEQNLSGNSCEPITQ